MELMYVGMTFTDFLAPFLIAGGIVFSLVWMMSSYEDARGAAFIALIVGIFIGLLGGANATNNRQADLINKFNLTYNVVITHGRIPSGPNEVGAVAVVRPDNSSEACVAVTDQSRYEVFCGGEELHPVK